MNWINVRILTLPIL